MTLMELFLGTVIGMVILISIITLISKIITKFTVKEVRTIKNIYTGKLVNTDASIQKAVEYLELKNSITNYYEGSELPTT